jgi:3'-phosphoadenosine 5'-phosphosulfate sulfotransferase (PAPS reductase)/FAD synthetase
MKHIVGFSGGCDSQACALWVRQRVPAEDIILLNSEAGRNEHPITVQFVKWYSENIFPVVQVVPLIKDLGNRGTMPGATRDRRREFSDDDELTFDRLAYVKGIFPSRKAQFCTESLKMAPQKRWTEENLPDGDFERYTGVRWQEGERGGCSVALPVIAAGGRRPRGRLHTPEREWDDYFDCYVNHPLASWTKAEVFAFLKEHGEPVNPLYTHGFSRVGCAPCINSGKEDIRLWAARFPEMIDKLRQWEKQNGRTFFAPCVPGYVINWVDEVVAWSRTSRGGKQFDLPMVEADAADGACSSRYGLCE